ncbi:MAG: hypothetical protein ACE5GT_10985 [Rhodospirillales bacterium]
MARDLTKLADEILTSPRAPKYAPHIHGDLPVDPGDPAKGTVKSASDASIAALANTVDPAIQVSRNVISSDEFMEAVDEVELEAMPEAKQAWIRHFDAKGSINIKNPRIRQRLGAIFAGPGAVKSRTALIALQTRPGTPAEALYGEGARVTHQEVAQALGRK